MRRLAVTAGAAALLGAAGCAGSTPYGSEPPEDGGVLEPVDADSWEPEDGDLPEPGDGDLPEPEDGDIEEPEDGGFLPPIQCEPEYRLSGDSAPVSAGTFACAEELPEDAPVEEIPTWLAAGQLCVAETAWRRLSVPEPMRARFTLYGGLVELELHDPAGELVATFSEDQPCLELDLTPGLWTLAAPPTNLPEDPEVVFEYSLDRLDGE